MKRILFFVLVLSLKVAVSGGILSENASISLLTATPGNELYAAFGHSAVRVHDPDTGLDEVYNYGTFDFGASNFYVNFVMGKLNYKLTVTSMRDFLMEYYIEGRGMVEQELNLSTQEKESVFAFLLHNRKPGNEYYLYDFFFDNCATRIRDLFDDNLNIDWNGDSGHGAQLTFRQLIRPYLYPNPWARFGVELALGLPTDRRATLWEEMFLPDYMYQAFQSAQHEDGRKLVRRSRVVFNATRPSVSQGFFSPYLVCWLVLMLGLLSLLRVRLARIFDKVFFTLLGAIGIVLLFLWLVTEHQPTNINLNLLWAIPFHTYFIYRAYLLFPIGIPRHYFKIVFYLNIVVLLTWPLIPQTFHPAFFPLIFLSAIKSFLYGFGDTWKKIRFFEKCLLKN